MAALTKDRATSYREGIEMDFPVAADTRIFAGSLVCVNASGFALPAADISGLRFIGVALNQADNRGGANGGKNLRVRRTGVFEFAATTITQAMVGDPMYAVDDQTFASAAVCTNDIKVGLLAKYAGATKGWIDISK
jgi:hypothetical protein